MKDIIVMVKGYVDDFISTTYFISINRLLFVKLFSEVVSSV